MNNTVTDTQLLECTDCGAVNRLALGFLDKKPVCGRCKATLTTPPWIITEANFTSAVEQSPLPVLLDLWAPWCGPCRLMAPVIDQLATELVGQVRVAKLNTDESQGIAQRFRIQGIPTLLIIRNGREIERMVGAYPKAAILQKLREVL